MIDWTKIEILYIQKYWKKETKSEDNGPINLIYNPSRLNKSFNTAIKELEAEKKKNEFLPP